MLVNPLVTWVWVGSIIVLLGALLAIWPSPDLLRQRFSAASAARIARDGARSDAAPKSLPQTAELAEENRS